jgi:hypothetical protein
VAEKSEHQRRIYLGERLPSLADGIMEVPWQIPAEEPFVDCRADVRDHTKHETPALRLRPGLPAHGLGPEYWNEVMRSRRQNVVRKIWRITSSGICA